MSKEEFIEEARKLNYTEEEIEEYLSISKDIEGFDYKDFNLEYREPEQIEGQLGG